MFAVFVALILALLIAVIFIVWKARESGASSTGGTSTGGGTNGTGAGGNGGGDSNPPITPANDPCTFPSGGYYIAESGECEAGGDPDVPAAYSDPFLTTSSCSYKGYAFPTRVGGAGGSAIEFVSQDDISAIGKQGNGTPVLLCNNPGGWVATDQPSWFVGPPSYAFGYACEPWSIGTGNKMGFVSYSIPASSYAGNGQQQGSGPWMVDMTSGVHYWPIQQNSATTSCTFLPAPTQPDCPPGYTCAYDSSG